MIFFNKYKDEIKKLHEEKLKPEEYRDKHQKEAKARSKSNAPDMGTYKPQTLEFETF